MISGLLYDMWAIVWYVVRYIVFGQLYDLWAVVRYVGCCMICVLL